MRRRTEKKPVRASRGISIRWKLILYMTAFVAVILLITWFFQVFLLDSFFQRVKKSEMQETAKELSAELENQKELPDFAYGVAVDCSLSVTIYRVSEGETEPVVAVDATGGDAGVMLSDEMLNNIYRKALENDGSCFSKIAFGGIEVDDAPLGNLLPVDGGKKPGVSKQNTRLVYAYLTADSAGETYLILLDTSLQPLNSTVRTLVTQYVWIAALILLAAGVLVLLLYRRISKPLILMNESAKQLAQGKSDVVFSGKGYRETRELAATLTYASHELSRLDRLQKELIANISHDLRTPLTMIKGYSEVMRDLPGENTPENMQIIIDETTRLSELVNDLLDLSRIQSGNRLPVMEEFHLTLAVREVMKRYDALTKYRGYHVEFSADTDAWVVADRGMLLQVLYNLINNAINYTGEDRQVRVCQTVADGRVRISVSDTGEGIEPDQIPLIWDRYYKVDKVHRTAMIGTGLGLSIVKGILEMHHAAYGVNSKLGEGSTFWFELPTREAPGTEDTEEEK